MDLETLRRRLGTAALSAFRVLPGRVKRALVRTGTPNYTVGAVCVLEHDGEVLFLSQPHRRGWSLPGGLLDRGETPAQAVVREVREEVGLVIDPGDPLVTGVHQRTQSVDVVFRVRLTQRPRLRLAHEARRARWWTPAQLRGADLETRQILALVRSAQGPAREGRLLGDAD
ncbi:NUDIX hydrolase [Ornithinicoccus hortensis]|uniref:ADP-ribose pyrophosphatase YjhB (NUDIX family) n=1 Tax=Ornithinicoccus hortensis TaxID=82346 RepID=A0A542YM27_9MICO|nr:NUDIX hydrolase [Ornithinicoccus hortensis]TQL49133.1 ADP-ribose pyrophosphatase YjhB (NUDIX family) [Ornithinicoccus hortensis]